MKDTRKRKTKKGDFGYFNSEKKRRLPDHRRIIFASTAHFLCGVGRRIILL